MNIDTAFITGTSSGLGRGLCETLLDDGCTVFGCSRRPSELPGLQHARCDLRDHETVPECLTTLLEPAERLDLVVLNAGVLGRIELLHRLPLDEAKAVMEVNLWSNKTVMDWLHAWGQPVHQVVMISSGAAVLGNKGWGAYALSKAALNMLAKLYAHEFPDTHICALAPGIIDTAMMDHLCDEADADAFPALQRLRAARGTEAMPTPREAARRILSVLPALREQPSGSFVDIRQLIDPEGYARLYGKR